MVFLGNNFDCGKASGMARDLDLMEEKFMHDVLRVNMMANIHDENDHIASHTNEDLTDKNIL